jgi:translation initiation factor 2B subunit (eIF-2B alpha/beta/delta family)
MILNEQEEKRIWESWLNKEFGIKLEEIRKAVEEIHKRNNNTYGNLPYYTPHGPKHCQAVEDLIHKLIFGDNYTKMSLKERFYLLASAWLHDLGMLPYVCSVVYKEEFPFSVNEIRKRHHVTSQKYIVENWFDLKINESDKEILGKLSRYHRRIEKLDPNDENFLVGTESFRLTLLASYLRLADSLDIGASRTPSEPYTICLAYDIPEDSKLHWIKSKLVNGIDINSENHTITIQFKCPNRQDIEGIIDLKIANEKIDSIINLVTEDLQAELSSVINIITRAGFSYFLDIKEKRSYGGLDRQMLNDLRELVINYDIMMAPSASRLLEIILITIANILGFSLIKKEEPAEFFKAHKKELIIIKEKVANFLSSVEINILSSRPCHLGLRNLIKECKHINSNLKGDSSLKTEIKKINDIFQNHHIARKNIRSNSKIFFSKILSERSENTSYNLLLYGYSELATKAICGLRDFLLKRHFDIEDPKMAYNGQFESSISEMIRIFICEGHPKTQTSYNDRLIYHDGSQYAFYLRARGFNNIIIIPDIISGTIIENIPIDFIVLGANGITRDFFTHSAGHASIVNLALAHRANNKLSKEESKIILVSTAEKFFCDSNLAQEKSLHDSTLEIEGCLFSVLTGFPANRTHIWMSRDTKLLEKLYKEKISFMNPREDQIPINKIDFIISDTGYEAIQVDKFDGTIKKLFPCD